MLKNNQLIFQMGKVSELWYKTMINFFFLSCFDTCTLTENKYFSTPTLNNRKVALGFPHYKIHKLVSFLFLRCWPKQPICMLNKLGNSLEISKVLTGILTLLNSTDNFTTTFFNHFNARRAEISKSEEEVSLTQTSFNDLVNPGN